LCPIAASRVAAARTILEDNEHAAPGNNMPQVSGFAILIADAHSAQALPVGPVLKQVTHQTIDQRREQ
jgi:hypothetical protein